MRHLVFLPEGPSEKEMLKSLMPKILPSECYLHY